MAKRRVPILVQATLDEAIEKLTTLTNPEDDRCGVAPEHREAVRLYVDTWITPRVQEVAKWAKGDLDINSLDFAQGGTLR